MKKTGFALFVSVVMVLLFVTLTVAVVLLVIMELSPW